MTFHHRPREGEEMKSKFFVGAIPSSRRPIGQINTSDVAPATIEREHQGLAYGILNSQYTGLCRVGRVFDHVHPPCPYALSSSQTA